MGKSVTASDSHGRRVTRPDLAVVAVLLAIAAAAWVSTAVRMAGMDAGLWTYPTDVGLYITTWIVMLAAMMFPSMAPMVLAYERTAPSDRAPRTAVGMTGVFVAGYLALWSAAGLMAYALLRLGTALDSRPFTGGAAGRYVAAGVILAAVAYELAPPKRACLDMCCAPFTFLRESRHDGSAGALRTGLKCGAWCVGCCWALMAALFALGVMSLTWMILISVLIMADKLLPSRRLATFGVASVLAALAIGLLVGAPISTMSGHGGAPM